MFTSCKLNANKGTKVSMVIYGTLRMQTKNNPTGIFVVSLNLGAMNPFQLQVKIFYFHNQT